MWTAGTRVADAGVVSAGSAQALEVVGPGSACESSRDETAVLCFPASALATARAMWRALRADRKIDIGDLVASTAAAATSIVASWVAVPVSRRLKSDAVF